MVDMTISIEFGIAGPKLIPALVTDRIGLQPTRAFGVGEEYLSKVFDPEKREAQLVVRKRSRGVWALDSRRYQRGLDAEKHALQLLNQLEPRRDAIAFYLNGEGYDVSFYIDCGSSLGTESYTLSSQLLGRMSSLCHFVRFAYWDLRVGPRPERSTSVVT